MANRRGDEIPDPRALEQRFARVPPRPWSNGAGASSAGALYNTHPAEPPYYPQPPRPQQVHAGSGYEHAGNPFSSRDPNTDLHPQFYRRPPPFPHHASNFPPSHNPPPGPLHDPNLHPFIQPYPERPPPPYTPHYPLHRHPGRHAQNMDIFERRYPTPPPAYRAATPPRTTRPQIISPVDLSERPESLTFRTAAELQQRAASTFRPLVGVVGRIAREVLGLPQQPGVRFDMYPVHMSRRTGQPLLSSRSSSRAPFFRITLPPPPPPAPRGAGTAVAEATRRQLDGVTNELREYLAGCGNAWYRQPGFVFRVAGTGQESRVATLAGSGSTSEEMDRARRRRRRRERRRYWVPPTCVYVPWFTVGSGAGEQGRDYHVVYVELARDDVRGVESELSFGGDEGEDDQDTLVDDMWRDVRRASREYQMWGPRS